MVNILWLKEILQIWKAFDNKMFNFCRHLQKEWLNGGGGCIKPRCLFHSFIQPFILCTHISQHALRRTVCEPNMTFFSLISASKVASFMSVFCCFVEFSSLIYSLKPLGASALKSVLKTLSKHMILLSIQNLTWLWVFFIRFSTVGETGMKNHFKTRDYCISIIGLF